MRFENPVKHQAMPWFMDDATVSRRLPTLPNHVKPHVEDMVRDGVTIIKASVRKETCTALIERFKALAALNMDKFESISTRTATIRASPICMRRCRS